MANTKKNRRVNAKGRNEGVTERFARLPHKILISEAYRSLDLTARALLVELIMIENGENNGSLWLSVKDAKDRLGLSDARPVMRAFTDLQDRELVTLTKDAHFSIKTAETSRARCWKLTWLRSCRKQATDAWSEYHAPKKTKARKRANRGLEAMARFRKALSAHKMPVVDSTITELGSRKSKESADIDSTPASEKKTQERPAVPKLAKCEDRGRSGKTVSSFHSAEDCTAEKNPTIPKKTGKRGAKRFGGISPITKFILNENGRFVLVGYVANDPPHLGERHQC